MFLSRYSSTVNTYILCVLTWYITYMCITTRHVDNTLIKIVLEIFFHTKLCLNKLCLVNQWNAKSNKPENPHKVESNSFLFNWGMWIEACVMYREKTNGKLVILKIRRTSLHDWYYIIDILNFLGKEAFHSSYREIYLIQIISVFLIRFCCKVQHVSSNNI